MNTTKCQVVLLGKYMHQTPDTTSTTAQHKITTQDEKQCPSRCYLATRTNNNKTTTIQLCHFFAILQTAGTENKNTHI